MKKLLPFLICLLIGCLLLWLICRWWPNLGICPCPDEPVVTAGETKSDPETDGDDCPSCGENPAATLTAQDTHHGIVWMPFDNGFDTGDTKIYSTTCTAEDATLPTCEYSDHFRTGVLLQLGSVRSPAGNPVYIEKVVLDTNEGTVELFPFRPAIESEEGKIYFDWLDINPQGDSCVLDPVHAYSLFPNAIVGTNCKVDSIDCSGTTNVPCDTISVPKNKEDCLRNRSLHASLWPEQIITYWPGVNFYTVDLQEQAGVKAGHGLFTFRMCDPIKVDHWLQGCFKKRWDEVRSIQIVTSADPASHNPFHDSPTDGGPFTIPGGGDDTIGP